MTVLTRARRLLAEMLQFAGSRTVRISSSPAESEPLLGQEIQEVGDAAGVAPLVVVPGDDLDEVAQTHRVDP